MTTTLALGLGLDRSLAWIDGGSVRYLVADLAANGPTQAGRVPPALNLALAIDVSGSMAGSKLAAARETASAVTRALTERDRLTLVAFDDRATLLLDARQMDTLGQQEALAAIERLRVGGSTNLWDGWLLAGEHVAAAMRTSSRASHRVLILSDGHANLGETDPMRLARHAGEALARGIITSAVGIGDGYDEALLGGITEAGGGRLHDAEHATEISEVVLAELLDGRTALLERVVLRVEVPAEVRAEVVGSWANTVVDGVVDLMVGTALPQTPKRLVIRLHCPAGSIGHQLVFRATARGMLPDGTGSVDAEPDQVALTYAVSRENSAQRRDLDRSMAAFTAWQSDVMRRTVNLNRDGDRRGAKHYLTRELTYLEQYGRDLPGTESMLAELVLLLRRAEEQLDQRTAKELYIGSMQRSRGEADRRVASRQSMSEVLRRK